MVWYPKVGVAERVREKSRRWNLRGKTNIIIDEIPKQMIKGIHGSFTLIDWGLGWVKGLLECGGVIHWTGKQLRNYALIGQAAR